MTNTYTREQESFRDEYSNFFNALDSIVANTAPSDFEENKEIVIDALSSFGKLGDDGMFSLSNIETVEDVEMLTSILATYTVDDSEISKRMFEIINDYAENVIDYIKECDDQAREEEEESVGYYNSDIDEEFLKKIDSITYTENDSIHIDLFDLQGIAEEIGIVISEDEEHSTGYDNAKSKISRIVFDFVEENDIKGYGIVNTSESSFFVISEKLSGQKEHIIVNGLASYLLNIAECEKQEEE